MAASLIFFGVDLATVDWYLVLYVLFSITIVAMGTTKLYTMGIPTAIIYAIGVTMVLIFYGYRWFDTKTDKTPTWPPTLNTCPDYLTYVKALPGSNAGSGCVDMLGVSVNGTLSKVLNSELAGTTPLASTKIFAATSELATDTTRILQLCNLCKTAGLTWEGIYDGDSCVGAGSNSAASAAKKASCNV
jgi:hypothetical protein